MQKSLPTLQQQRQVAHKRLSIGAMAGRALWLALVVIIAPLCLFIDLNTLGNNISEASLVELTQLVFLFLSASCFFYLAYKKVDDRAFAILAAAFFLTMLIREMDAYFDVIVHGFWKYIAAPIALSALVYAYQHGEKTIVAMSRFMRSQAGVVMVIGLVILLFYSRLMGMTSLWKGLMGDAYIRVIKNAVEESAELLGYSLIFAASARYLLHRLRTKKQAVFHG